MVMDMCVIQSIHARWTMEAVRNSQQDVKMMLLDRYEGHSQPRDTV